MNTNAHVRSAILAGAKRASDRTLHHEHRATTVTLTTRA